MPRDTWTEKDWLEWQANYLAGALLMPEHRVKGMLEESVLLREYRDSVQAKRLEPKAFDRFVRALAGAFRVSQATARIRLEHVGFKRLSDQSERVPSPFDLLAPAALLSDAARECLDAAAIADWEDKHFDPDYIFPRSLYNSVTKRGRSRTEE